VLISAIALALIPGTTMADNIVGTSADEVLVGTVGGEGTDVACAIDDEITVDEGVQSVLNLGANDDALEDEALETEPLRYYLVNVPASISAMLDELTAILTFTASQSGTIGYEVCRAIVGAAPGEAERICSEASGFIKVNPVKKVASTPAEAVLETGLETVLETALETGLEAQVLPNTGASDDPRVLVPLGLALVLGGAVLIGTQRRRTI
jgi:LPXTG-motif cell wall-anchored protein